LSKPQREPEVSTAEESPHAHSRRHPEKSALNSNQPGRFMAKTASITREKPASAK
jgi:hypothetical protein